MLTAAISFARQVSNAIDHIAGHGAEPLLRCGAPSSQPESAPHAGTALTRTLSAAGGAVKLVSLEPRLLTASGRRPEVPGVRGIGWENVCAAQSPTSARPDACAPF